MNSSLKKWRESASVLILARTVLSSTSAFDYQLLMVKRNAKSSVLPNVAVFPGGVLDRADTNRDWLKLYEKYGLKSDSFNVFNRKSNRLPIFSTKDPNEIPRNVSLRIAAIRETFEETGLLICRNAKNILDAPSPWADYIASEEIRKWQRRINQNPNNFIELCSQFEILPDVWSLNEWSNWVTPASVKNKFNAIFFTAVFRENPPTVADEVEISQVLWKTPQQYLDICKQEKVFTHTPQLYEISRLHELPQIKNVLKFIEEHKYSEMQSYWPHIIATDSGLFFILPGDGLYPKNIDETNENHEYLKELPNSDVHHRLEMLSSGRLRLSVRNYSLIANPVASLRNKL